MRNRCLWVKPPSHSSLGQRDGWLPGKGVMFAGGVEVAKQMMGDGKVFLDQLGGPSVTFVNLKCGRAGRRGSVRGTRCTKSWTSFKDGGTSHKPRTQAPLEAGAGGTRLTLRASRRDQPCPCLHSSPARSVADSLTSGLQNLTFVLFLATHQVCGRPYAALKNSYCCVVVVAMATGQGTEGQQEGLGAEGREAPGQYPK